MYGTAISKYFTQMEDGTYRLITASTDFAKTIDDLEERKIEAAIKTEIESIRTFDEEYDKILNDFVFNTIPDSDDGISASKIKTLDEIIKVKGYENASLTGKDLNKTEGFSESQTHAVL